MEEKDKRSPLLRELLYIPNLQSPMKTGKRRPIRGCWSGREEKGRFSVGGSHERRLAARRAVRGKYLLMKSFCSLARERKGQKNAGEEEEEEEKEEQKVRSSYYFSSSRVSLFTSAIIASITFHPEFIELCLEITVRPPRFPLFSTNEKRR